MKKFTLLFILFSVNLVQAQNLVPYTKNKLWGFCDQQKNIVIQPQYKRIDFFRDGLARVLSADNDRYGIINEKGETIVPFEYPSIQTLGIYAKDRIYFQKDKKYGYFNGKGEVVVEPQYEFAYSFLRDSPNTPAKKNGKYGIIDKNGEVVLPFEHPPMSVPSETGYVTIYTDKGNGLMDLNGKVIVPAIYREKELHTQVPLPQLKQNFAHIHRKDGAKDNAIIFNNGKELLYYTAVQPFDNDHFFHNQYLMVNIPNLNSLTGAKRALVDINGDPILIWDNYPYVGDYNDQAVVVGKKKGSDIIYGLINTKGETILKPKYEKITKFDAQGIARYEYKGESGFINDKGQIVQSEKSFDNVISFGFARDGLIYFKGDNGGGIMTYEGKVLFNHSDQYQYLFAKHGLIIRKDRATKKELLINKTGKILTDEYTKIGERDYGFQVFLDKKEGVLDKTGKVILEAVNQDVNYIKEGFFVIKKDNLKTLTDLLGNQLLPGTYTDIRLIRGTENYWIKNDQYKWYMMKKDGTPANKQLYSKIEYYRDGLYNVKAEKWGLVDSTGKEVVPPVCREPLKYIKSDELLGVVRYKSIIYGYIGKDYTLFWD